MAVKGTARQERVAFVLMPRTLANEGALQGEGYRVATSNSFKPPVELMEPVHSFVENTRQ